MLTHSRTSAAATTTTTTTTPLPPPSALKSNLAWLHVLIGCITNAGRVTLERHSRQRLIAAHPRTNVQPHNWPANTPLIGGSVRRQPPKWPAASLSTAATATASQPCPRISRSADPHISQPIVGKSNRKLCESRA